MGAIILFDGVCNLCNGSVNFTIDRDKEKYFKFASIQSEAGRKLLREFNLDPDKLYSLILIKNGNFYDRSTAALKIAKHLDGLWKIFYILIIIPKFMRDFFYNLIANRRYKWFGKRETCRVPTPELKERFLSDSEIVR